VDDGGVPGRLLIIGGAEDRCCGSGVLERFTRLCGGAKARVVVITTATGKPASVLAEYERVFRKLGVRHVRELAIGGRSDADGAAAAAALDGATGVFLSGGDQARLQTLVGSKINEQLAARLDAGLVIAGTSAGATALGRTMILGNGPAEDSAGRGAAWTEERGMSDEGRRRLKAPRNSGGSGPRGPGVSPGGNRESPRAHTVKTAPGLGLIPRMLIDMHFGERGRLPRLLSAVALDPDKLGVGIDENTAICVLRSSFEVIGAGAVSVVDAQKATVVHAASDADPITLFDVRLHLLPAGCVFDLDARSAAIGPAHARY